MNTRTSRWAWLGLLLLAPGWTGCAAFRPIDGVPARYVPPELKAGSRSGKKTIDLSLLRQPPSPEYRVDAGDVLAVYIEGVLGNRDEPPPVHFPQDSEGPPTLGFPLPVREDGTISLPLIGSVDVRGKTVVEVEEMLRRAYTDERQILKPGRQRILISLHRRRTYRVLVIRQEAGAPVTAASGTLNLGVAKRGTGQIVNLPAYSNDVLHALAETGGLPGLDAENTIYVIRRRPSQSDSPAPPPGPQTAAPIQQAAYQTTAPAGVHSAGFVTAPGSDYRYQTAPASMTRAPAAPVPPSPPSPPTAPGAWGHTHPPPVLSPPMHDPPYGAAASSAVVDGRYLGPADLESLTVDNPDVVKIPVRLGPGDRPLFRPQDVILEDGDVVFIESRDTEVFYTGGLLGGGQYTLPRDYDLDVLAAISIAQSGNQSGNSDSLGGASSLNNDVTISASNVIILRTYPDGSQVPIKVDLYRAVRDPAERIIIQPGDFIMLQYTRAEAIAAFIERHLLEGALFSVAAASLSTNN